MNAASAAPPSLALVDVTKSYRTPHHVVDVLRGITFELAAGESLAITGPSGSGKSTLLHLIGTLERPTSGEISVGGVRAHDLPEAELAAFRNRRIGFVFQDHHLLPQYSVIENVVLPSLAERHARKPGAPDAVSRARELLAAVGLEGRLEHRPAELSGGERQRVAIARSLINGPGLLLCDEPTGNLDRTTAESVADLLFRLHGESGTLLVIVTHSAELAARCRRRYELVEGRCSPA